MDIIFVAECYVPKSGLGMINMMGYKLVTEVKVGMRIMAYWRQGTSDVCEVIIDEVDAIGIKWQGRKIVGVYGRRKVEGGNGRYEVWLKKVTSVL